MKDSKIDTKFDAPLRMKLKEVKQAADDAPLKCLVKLNGPIDDNKEKIFKETGIKVLTVVNEIVTVEGQADAIRKIANHDFVQSISLSQTRYPLKK